MTPACRAAVTACVLLAACAARAAFAQQKAAADYPSRAIRLVVPYPAGSSIDFPGHVLGPKIGAAYGQNFFIENRAGAAGAIGADVVAKAAPDGYTMLLTSSSHASLPSVYKNLPYDTLRDFAPVTLAARSVGSVLVIHPSVPARTLKEFIAFAKARPNTLNYGSGGVGNIMQFAAELFNVSAGTRITHVPYKGSAQVIVDLAGGRIEMGVISAVVVRGHVRSGKLRALAITAPQRWEKLAEVPTMAEAGVHGCEYAAWYGFWFPAGTPAEYAARFHAETVRAFDDPAIRGRFSDEGLIPVGSTPQAFGKTILAELEFHRGLVARIGLQPQ
jgi:tripartite-type tricarboxylate transporter receptor subunit TctC